MTEDEARQWIADRPDVSRETLDALQFYVGLLLRENDRQNLISGSTEGLIWNRHIADSVQLCDHIPASSGVTLDLGSGPGLPGLVLALLKPRMRWKLVESRALRCAFLQTAVETLPIRNVEIVCANLKVVRPFASDVIVARAFAPLLKLIDMARPFSSATTRWVLPRGAGGIKEWQGLPRPLKAMFHVEQSVTDEQAVILIGEGIA